jgi:hypothetical protein
MPIASKVFFSLTAAIILELASGCVKDTAPLDESAPATELSARVRGGSPNAAIATAHTVNVDTSALTYTSFRIPDVAAMPFIDGATSPPVDLSEGRHSFQQAGGYFADFTFEVNPDGTVDYSDEFAGFLSGRGTSTLVVTGRLIHVDATGLSHGLLPLFGGARTFLMPDSVHDIRLVPASHYGFQPGGGIVANFQLKVDLSGNTIVDPQYAGFASASGNTVTIHGYTINIDGRALSHDLLPISLGGYTKGFLPRASVNQVTVIPSAGHRFQPTGGIVADLRYTVDLSGMVTVDSVYAGFASADGNTLRIKGYPVLIDATDADSDLVSLLGIPVKTEAHRYLFAVLIPCNGYGLQTTHGVFAHGFNVLRDGSVTFDSAVTGKLLVSTVPRLEIHGSTPF